MIYKGQTFFLSLISSYLSVHVRMSFNVQYDVTRSNKRHRRLTTETFTGPSVPASCKYNDEHLIIIFLLLLLAKSQINH